MSFYDEINAGTLQIRRASQIMPDKYEWHDVTSLTYLKAYVSGNQNVRFELRVLREGEPCKRS